MTVNILEHLERLHNLEIYAFLYLKISREAIDNQRKGDLKQVNEIINC